MYCAAPLYGRPHNAPRNTSKTSAESQTLLRELSRKALRTLIIATTLQSATCVGRGVADFTVKIRNAQQQSGATEEGGLYGIPVRAVQAIFAVGSSESSHGDLAFRRGRTCAVRGQRHRVDGSA